MKPVIVYYSQTGFTKQYALWLAKALSCPLISFEKRDTVDFSRYDTVVFGSWCHAGQLKKFKWFQGRLPEWKDKKKAVFAVGASPADNPETEGFLKRLEGTEKNMKAFYLPGGLRYENMGAASRAMMKLFSSMVGKKKNKTPEEEVMARMLRHSYDISDPAYMEPLLAYIRQAGGIPESGRDVL